MNLTHVLADIHATYGRELKENPNGQSVRQRMIGISYPDLMVIARKIQGADPVEFLLTKDCSFYELEILQTMVIGSIKEITTAITHFKAFAPKAKEWSVVDSLCQRFVIARKYPDEIFNILTAYAKSEDEYMERIVAVTALSHYLHEDTIDQVVGLLNHLNHPGYYAKMAKAWALATMMINFPEITMECLDQPDLDPWTKNKAIQKMLESRRITDALKARLKIIKNQNADLSR